MGKSTGDDIQKILREVDLQGLNEKEKEQVFKLLREEADVFCLDSDDFENVTECKMKIQLKDQTPVQKTYYSMPKPLHLEVKHYIEDLLNKGRITKSITKSTSHYLHQFLRFERKMEVFDCAFAFMSKLQNSFMPGSLFFSFSLVTYDCCSDRFRYLHAFGVRKCTSKIACLSLI